MGFFDNFFKEPKVSPMEGRDGEPDITPDEAAQATARLRMEGEERKTAEAVGSLQGEIDAKKPTEQIKEELKEVLDGLEKKR